MFEISSPNNIVADATIECTICAEPIPDYEPTLFNGVEMNPACKPRKTPSLDIVAHSVKIETKLSNLAKDDIALKHGKEKVKPAEKIRQAVKKKLDERFNNGEINREEIETLEEVLVKELKEEILGENEND